MKPLGALALVCTLNPSPKPSSSQLMAEQVLAKLAEADVTGSVVRVVDHDVKPPPPGWGTVQRRPASDRAPRR